MAILTIMVGTSANQMKGERYVLHDVIPPIMLEGIYEMVPPGYIIFPSFQDYKKIKKSIDKTISRFLERRGGILKEETLYKCLEIIESIIEVCDKMRLGTSIEHTFNKAFPNVIKFIEEIGYEYKDDKLFNFGILFVNESKRDRYKYIKIVETLYKKKSYCRG